MEEISRELFDELNELRIAQVRVPCGARCGHGG